ncbi:MAG: creatininase family protein, partial [Anaerolineae bacterium]|nr:creatininase family protein [Anaerolineae bacterium]
ARAREAQPAIYVPFGSIEWHGYHNPVGLDAVKAHEQLVGLASRVGGVVYPPVYFGAGGGHTDWPSSFMVPSEPMVRIVTELLHGFERDGYRKAILLSGHYPNRTEYLDAARTAYLAEGGTMDVLALVENEAPGAAGDHAAKAETSYMLHLLPELVDMARLQTGRQDDLGGPNEAINWMGPEFAGHPNYGLVGIDPRAHASADAGRAYTEALLSHLAAWVER